MPSEVLQFFPKHSCGKKAPVSNFSETRIIDHHLDTGSHPDAVRQIDDSCGSTCSLLAEIALKGKPWQDAMPQDMASMLWATVLMDTRHFSKDKVWNKRDEDMVKALASSTPDKDSMEWFEKLINARFDVSGFSPSDMLKVDCKTVDVRPGLKIAVTSVFETAQVFVDVVRLYHPFFLGGGVDQIGWFTGKEKKSRFIPKYEAGGPQKTADALKQAAEEKGARAMLALSKKDGGFKHGVLFSFDEGVTKCIREGICGAPGNLTDEMRGMPLFY